MPVTEFTPLASSVGGALIGLAAVLLMATHGRIAGVSGIAVRMFPPYFDNQALGRIAFVAGLVVAPLVYATVTGAWAPITMNSNTTPMIAAALLTGFGAVWGNGCTSGHGVCGLSRLSVRSLAAVITFMAVAALTTFFARPYI
jgi:uncharacterized protein